MAHRALLFLVKAAHSLIFLVLQTSILYLLHTGLPKQTDRKTAIVAGVIGAECAIYAGNGFRCPLTGIAEDLGAERGSVTDIFLPKWLARQHRADIRPDLRDSPLAALPQLAVAAR